MAKRIISAMALSLFLMVCTQISAQDVGKEIVGLWHFDEGEGIDVKDSSGNDNHGKIRGVGGAIWIKGIAGAALEFDGTNDVEVPSSESLCFDGPITIEAWIKTSFQEGGRIVFKNRYDGAHDVGYSLVIKNKIIRFSLSKGEEYGYTSNFVKSEIEVTDDKWHYIVGTYDGSVMKLYIDGKLDLDAQVLYEGG